MSLSAIAIQPPSAIYREDQRFGWWIYALLGLMMAMSWALLERRGQGWAGHGLQHLFGVSIGLSLPVLMVLGVLRMTTLVTPTGVRVWFGFIPTYRHEIPIPSIARVEVVVYRPIIDAKGWGVRIGPDGERILNARGNRGVRLHLVDGSRILIGSQRPDELALAVKGALSTGH